VPALHGRLRGDPGTAGRQLGLRPAMSSGGGRCGPRDPLPLSIVEPREADLRRKARSRIQFVTSSISSHAFMQAHPTLSHLASPHRR
jgi:hypothetical protein